MHRNTNTRRCTLMGMTAEYVLITAYVLAVQPLLVQDGHPIRRLHIQHIF